MLVYPKYRRPVADGVMFEITQSYGNELPQEPLGWMGEDGWIYYERPSVRAVQGHFHNGIDYVWDWSKLAVAAGSGFVWAAGVSPTGFGLRLVVKSHGYLWLYGHCAKLLVSVGDFVKQGEEVAVAGASTQPDEGNASGPHLHFSVMSVGGLAGVIEYGPYVSPARFVFSQGQMAE